ncbi:MAG: DUF1501 domain-containing protein, partial [Verrucomicrobiota bacterium]
MIYLFQSGGPPQQDLFDYKPHLDKVHGEETPESVFNGQRLTGMTSGQKSFPVARSIFNFKKHGQGVAWICDVMPHLAEVADELCFIKSMQTEAINHDPAITFLQTGFQIAGRPSIGAWLSYGLGSENDNLPGFVAMLSGSGGQPLYDRLWGAGFLPSEHQGVRFRSGKNPVLFLGNPDGFETATRRKTLDALADLNRMRLDVVGDPNIDGRIHEYEMAFRMQTSSPELVDLSGETEEVRRLYGIEGEEPSFARNCLLARRMVERGVRFVQLYHADWDHHGDPDNNLGKPLEDRCREVDQASAALV